MSYLLELLGRGLETEIGDVLRRIYGPASSSPLEQLQCNVHNRPNRADLRREFGIRLLCSDHIPEAIGQLSIACQLAGDDVPARAALAAAYEAGSAVEDASRQLELLVTDSPEEPNLLFALGSCYERLQRPEEAAGCYRRAIATDGRFDAARERLAAISVMLGDDAEAIQQYEHLRKGVADETWYLSVLGHLYYRQGEFCKAMANFESAAVAGPENWSLLDDTIERLIEARRFSEAMLRLDDLIEKQPCFPDLHVRLGDLYVALGQDDAAMACYVRATELQPDYMEAVIKIGTQHSAAGRWDQAAEAYCQAAEINDRCLRSYIGLGVTQLAAGKADQAAVSFDLAGSIEPNSGQLMSETVRLQLMNAMADEHVAQAGREMEAPSAAACLGSGDLLSTQLQRHEHAVAVRPGDSDLRMRYGMLLRNQGKLAEAAEQFRCVLRAIDAHMDATIKLGITLADMEQDDGAAAMFKQAFDVTAEQIGTHYRLGLLYTDRRLFEKAVRSMEEAAPQGRDNVRTMLAASLQNMGLLDRSAATWRSLCQIHNAHVRKD